MHRKAWSSIAKTVYSLLWVILSPTNCQRPTSPISESFSLEFSPHADYVRDFQKFNWINFHYFLYCLIYLLASNWIPKLMKPVFFFSSYCLAFFPWKFWVAYYLLESIVLASIVWKLCMQCATLLSGGSKSGVSSHQIVHSLSLHFSQRFATLGREYLCSQSVGESSGLCQRGNQDCFNSFPRQWNLALLFARDSRKIVFNVSVVLKMWWEAEYQTHKPVSTNKTKIGQKMQHQGS